MLQHPIYAVVKWLNVILREPDGRAFFDRFLVSSFKTTNIDLADNSPFQFGIIPPPAGCMESVSEPPCYLLSGLGLLNGCFSDNYVIACERYCDSASTIAGFHVAKVDPESGAVTVLTAEEL